MIQTVVKRDGRIVGFNEQKIMAAVRKAMLHTDKGEDERLVQQIADRIGFAGTTNDGGRYPKPSGNGADEE